MTVPTSANGFDHSGNVKGSDDEPAETRWHTWRMSTEPPSLRRRAVDAARVEWSEIGVVGRVAFAGVVLSLAVYLEIHATGHD